MNPANHILEYLTANSKAEISSFGIFGLKNSGAKMNDGQKILPPAKEVTFVPDYETKDRGFLKFVSEKENISEFEAELALKKYTNQWKAKLDADQEIYIENVGTFRNNENGIFFKGERIETSAPDFYGLEEIKISEIKKADDFLKVSEDEENEENSYRFNNSILWIFLIAVPVLGILYFGITNQEMIFGKKTDFSVKNSTHRIEKKPAQTDSLKNNIVQDSLKKDSVKITETPLTK